MARPRSATGASSHSDVLVQSLTDTCTGRQAKELTTRRGLTWDCVPDENSLTVIHAWLTPDKKLQLSIACVTVGVLLEALKMDAD
jgi:hypothetical protein